MDIARLPSRIDDPKLYYIHRNHETYSFSYAPTWSIFSSTLETAKGIGFSWFLWLGSAKLEVANWSALFRKDEGVCRYACSLVVHM